MVVNEDARAAPSETPSRPARPARGSELVDQTAREVEHLELQEQEQERLQDRIADRLTRSMGSMGFIGLNAAWFAAWIVLNLPGMPTEFDPFPFSLLTMIVSLEAIMLSVLVLITENAQARRADRRARIDMQVDIIAEREITRLMRLVAEIHEHLGLPHDSRDELQEMERTTPVREVARAVDSRFADDGTPREQDTASSAEQRARPQRAR